MVQGCFKTKDSRQLLIEPENALQRFLGWWLSSSCFFIGLTLHERKPKASLKPQAVDIRAEGLGPALQNWVCPWTVVSSPRQMRKFADHWRHEPFEPTPKYCWFIHVARAGYANMWFLKALYLLLEMNATRLVPGIASASNPQTLDVMKPEN